MAELRSINATRDQMIRAIAAAEDGAPIVVLIDRPNHDTTVIWTGFHARVFAWFSTVLSELSVSQLKKRPST